MIGQIFFPTVIFVCAGMFGIHATSFPIMELQEGFGPGLFPKLIAVAVMVLCAFEIAREIMVARRQKKVEMNWGITRDEAINCALLIIAVVTALLAMPYVGFVVAGSALVMLLSIIMGLRPLWKGLLTSVIITTSLYWIFSEGFGIIFSF